MQIARVQSAPSTTHAIRASVEVQVVVMGRVVIRAEHAIEKSARTLARVPQERGQLQAPRALFPADGFGYATTLPIMIDENLDGFPDLLYVGSHEGDKQSAGSVTVVHQRPH